MQLGNLSDSGFRKKVYIHFRNIREFRSRLSKSSPVVLLSFAGSSAGGERISHGRDHEAG